MMRLKIHSAIRENRDFSTMKNYKLLFVPSTEIMAEKDQEALVDLAKNGTTIIMCGLMPKYDEHFKECLVLSNHFRIKTTCDYHIGTVTHKNGSFPTYIYGQIRPPDDGRIKRIASEGTKL